MEAFGRDMYYDDIELERVVRRFFSPSEKSRVLCTENNSLEFIRFGHLELQMTRSGRTIDLTAGTVFWMKKNEEYRFIPPSQNQQGKYIEHIYFDFLGERSERIIAALDELYPDRMFQPRNPEEVHNIFSRILCLYRIDAKEKLPEIGMLIEQLLFIAYDSTQPGSSGLHDAHNLERIAEEIKSDPFKDYDFHKIASKVNLSMDHFRRLFREKHQLPPQGYLWHQRMIRAAELLGKTDMSIKEIMFTCNFKSLMDFSRKFKKYTGLSPMAYRKNIQKSNEDLRNQGAKGRGDFSAEYDLIHKKQ
jgi:AraC-like DNA-binding protein